MATSESRSSDQRYYANRPAYIHIGTDDRNIRHCLDTKTRTVHLIFPDGGRERILLGDRTVAAWIDHIRDAHGWDLQMSKSKFHALFPDAEVR